MSAPMSSLKSPVARIVLDPERRVLAHELLVLVVDQCLHQQREQRAPALQDSVERGQLPDHRLAG
jgi:hypothetical protein